MGSLSVSEAPVAPARRSEGDALPVTRTALRPVPAHLQLAQATTSELRFAGRSGLRAPVVLSPVLFVLGSLTWLAPTPSDGTRVLGSLLCLACALATILVSWPRKLELCVRPGEGTWRLHRQIHALPEAPRWRLCTEQRRDSPQLRYLAVLQLDAGPAWPLLSDADPAAVLRQLHAVLAHWNCPVDNEWGLPREAAPWSFEASTPLEHAGSGTATIVRGPPPPAGLRWTMIVASVVVLLDLITLVLSASARVERVHALSLILPGLTGGSLVAVTLAVLSVHQRLSIGRELRQEASVLGLRRLCGTAVSARAVRAVYLLAPEGARPRHLLVDTEQGPLSLPVSEHQPERLRDEVSQALAQAARA
jgi:hypothetical protein